MSGGRAAGVPYLAPLAPRPRAHLERLPERPGMLALVTGANGTLGLELSRQLATKGVHVVLAARSQERGDTAREELQRVCPGASATVMRLDLSSLADVARFAREFLDRFERLDLLFANAGIMAVRHRLTEDGVESQFGVNHLGHFALVGGLLDALLDSDGARVVTTTSSASYFARLRMGEAVTERAYNRWLAYADSKLANVVFAFALQQRFASAGAAVSALSAHPGLVHSNLQRQAVGDRSSRLEEFFLETLVPAMGQSAQMGALPLTYAGLSTRAEGGQFWGPRWRFLRGDPIAQHPPRRALDSGVQERLWEASVRLSGVSYERLSAH